ncbi:hypothetical protein [Rhizobium sp. Root1220]|uniref:hypothetical protein n=1 Tax=Rhizobium sp. Root1220 TaxID=1736432 RepID=UPI0006F565A5|nr:hypothetical protein [Rhizobium sp. Root1220]KQV66032.1 hypothetical protein ASC90_12520 [Rhizobium sp. Root1220]
MNIRSTTFHLAMIATLQLVIAVAAGAHQRGGGGTHNGIAVPEISHGEMVMFAEQRDRIIDLASRATDTNEPFRRVLNYAQIQYAYCLWGVAPGAVVDEASPFNECSHAYLAATKAVLLAMRDMPREAAAAGEMVSLIDAGMVLRGLALITCQFSGESFNTADVIRPSWRGIPTHPASMGALSGLLALFATVTFGCRWLLRRAAP